MAEHAREIATNPPGREPLLLAPGHALTALVAILAFLACLTVGTIGTVRSALENWRSNVAREVTIQLRPMAAKEAKAAIERVGAIAKTVRGVRGVRALSDDETKKLLEPWLGANVDLEAIPVPRLLVVELSAADADLDGFRRRLGDEVKGAAIDDHRGWHGRLARTAATISAIGAGVLAMVIVAVAISAAMAARGAAHANRPVVEVLHFVGARNAYIARLFQRRFFAQGLKGSLIGGVLAALPFAFVILSGMGSGNPGEGTLVGLQASLGFSGFLQIALTALGLAVLVALTARLAVMRLLQRID
jgi:cell division transport system permease protein